MNGSGRRISSVWGWLEIVLLSQCYEMHEWFFFYQVKWWEKEKIKENGQFEIYKELENCKMTIISIMKKVSKSKKLHKNEDC